jgi:hypothetical protein
MLDNRGVVRDLPRSPGKNVEVNRRVGVDQREKGMPIENPLTLSKSM